tara:strand:+ start:176 stop:640 length:465 start_codon:yes stop_codon:yes gene_type:complete
MDKLSRKILQNTMRFLSAKGYRVLSEFALPNKKRVDIIGINLKKEIVIVEVKSNKNGIKLDKKWKNYLNYCNYFYFACSEKLNLNFSENIGIIRNNCNKIEITKEPKYKKLPENKKNKLIFKISLSAISKFHRLIDPEYKKQRNNSIYIYKKKK